ncbi:MAG: hypothetical protein QG638_1054, partial [Pseudomonadota bacterium]|nr:hypothetical protein [Pseudomonadota bacterium]
MLFRFLKGLAEQHRPKLELKHPSQ